MISSDFKFNFQKLSWSESTNSYALERIKSDNHLNGTVFYTFDQRDGRGQRGSQWQTEPGKNLLFSLIIYPNIEASRQVMLSQMVALGLKNFLDSLSVEKVKIKWPNDLLVNERKIAGVLIENSLEGSIIRNSIIGIGLNVNQTNFPLFQRNATSLALSKGREFDLDEVLHSCLDHLKASFQKYGDLSFSAIQEDYLSALYGYDQAVFMEDKRGHFLGRIKTLRPDGKLEVLRNGKSEIYDLKELVFTSQAQ